MATVNDVLHVAASQIGYVEGGGADGKSGNITKYWQDLDPGLQGQPWCACFVRWTDKHSGGPLLPITNPYYCPSIVTYARIHGLWKSTGSPGDYALFDFSGTGVAEHIGRVVKYESSDITIEGNTSSGSYGSQANGGGVYKRERAHSLIMGYVNYSSLLTKDHSTPSPPAPRKPLKSNPFTHPSAEIKLGDTGEGVKFVQWAVGVPVDGTFGPQTEHAVKLFQQYHGLTVDGVVGINTRAKLAHVQH